MQPATSSLPTAVADDEHNVCTKKEKEIQRDEGGKVACPRNDRLASSRAAHSYTEGITQSGETQTHIGKNAGGRLSRIDYY